MEGVFHIYQKKPVLNLFEYTLGSTSTHTPHQTSANVLLFIGGLYDNFQSPEYLADLARLFPRHDSQQWSLIHAQLSSAIRGFGTCDLDTDAHDMTAAIIYIREVIRRGQSTNIVLLGQSTGCQDVLHYLHSPADPEGVSRPVVQGAVLQAPLSDRDSTLMRKMNVNPEAKDLYDKCLSLISTIPESRHKMHMLPLDWTMPLYGRAPLSISRFLDLASPSSPGQPRKEDLFSIDLPLSRLDATFGRVGPNEILTRSSNASTAEPSLLILISESDTDVLKPHDADYVLGRWAQALSRDADHPIALHPRSKMIKHATHDISGNTPGELEAKLVVFRESLLRYLDDVVGGVGQFAWDSWKSEAEELEHSGK